MGKMKPPKRPELPRGWQWEDSKISTAWGPNGMCTKAAIGPMVCYGDVPDAVKTKVVLANKLSRVR